jgi:single-strand DNA-binding protein
MTADPELRQTDGGKSVVIFFDCSRATSRTQRSGARYGLFENNGLRVSSATYVHNYLKKGRLIACDGRLEVRKWQDQNPAILERLLRSSQIILHALDRGDGRTAIRSEGEDPFEEAS